MDLSIPKTLILRFTLVWDVVSVEPPAVPAAVKPPFMVMRQAGACASKQTCVTDAHLLHRSKHS